MSNKNEEQGKFTKEEIIFIMSFDSSNEDVLYALVNTLETWNDPEWLQKILLKFTEHKDQQVVSTALLGLAKLIRIFGTKDLSLVKHLTVLKARYSSVVDEIDKALALLGPDGSK